MSSESLGYTVYITQGGLWETTRINFSGHPQHAKKKSCPHTLVVCKGYTPPSPFHSTPSTFVSLSSLPLLYNTQIAHRPVPAHWVLKLIESLGINPKPGSKSQHRLQHLKCRQNCWGEEHSSLKTTYQSMEVFSDREQQQRIVQQ